MFYQGRLIESFKTLSDNGDLEEIHGNILFASVLDNMKLMKKNDVIASKVTLSVRCTNSNYLEDYHVITKMDNPVVIKNFIEQTFKEGKSSDTKIFLTSLLMYLNLLIRGRRWLQLF